ncbi:MAG: hypothetical protein WHS89_11200 [Acidimicrobiales bacterium]
MKKRSRVAAVAAAAGLVGGMLAFGSGTSSAVTVLLDCDKVLGNGTVSPGISNQSVKQDISIKSAKNYTAPCTGALAGQTGDAIAVSAKFTTDPDPKQPLITGGFSCDTSATTPDPPYPPYGKLSTKFANINPLTGKNFASSAFVRLGSIPGILDGVTITGIVTKGTGVGADVSGSFLQHPTWKNGVPPLSGTSVGASASSLDLVNGEVVAGYDSLQAGLDCLSGTATLTGVIFGTDGTSLLNFVSPPATLDSSVVMSFPV